MIETYYLLDRRITLTQDEAFLQTRSVFEPERDYTVAETGLEPTRLRPKRSMLAIKHHSAIKTSYTHVPEAITHINLTYNLTFYKLNKTNLDCPRLDCPEAENAFSMLLVW